MCVWGCVCGGGLGVGVCVCVMGCGGGVCVGGVGCVFMCIVFVLFCFLLSIGACI